jgi:hypothetical protein
MSRTHLIRISGRPRTPLDADLMAQLIVLLGRQLAAEAEGFTTAPPDEPVTPSAPGAASA